MKILDEIKNIFRKFKQKKIAESSESKIQQNLSFTSNNTKKAPYLSKMDSEILSFLQNYYNRLQTNPYSSAYSALYTIKSTPVTEEEASENLNQEQDLKNWINSNNLYFMVSMQPDSDGKPTFFHVQSQKYTMKKSQNKVRFYINCKNQNISALVRVLLETNTNPNFYLKFTSNDFNKRKNRSDKIVIFCNEDEKDYIIELLQYNKNLHPELFEGTENTLPFFKSVNNLASFTHEVSKEYKDLHDKVTIITSSPNSFLSKILIESYMRSLS